MTSLSVYVIWIACQQVDAKFHADSRYTQLFAFPGNFSMSNYVVAVEQRDPDGFVGVAESPAVW